MTVTGYTACDEGMRCDGITASGMMVEEGICACGPSWDFGTVFYLESLASVLICMDRGSAITDDRLDIYFRVRQDALEFGRQELEVVVVWWEVNHEQRDQYRTRSPR